MYHAAQRLHGLAVTGFNLFFLGMAAVANHPASAAQDLARARGRCVENQCAQKILARLQFPIARVLIIGDEIGARTATNRTAWRAT